MEWRIPNRLQFLWEKIKKQGDAESQSASNSHQPSADLPPYRHRAIHHHPDTHEVQHRAAEQEYWQDQLRLAKDLNVITKALNTFTIRATIVAGLAALVGVGGLIILWCTLVETIEYNRVDQRAWVGATMFNTQLVADTEVSFPVVVKNVGKTPAVKMKEKMNMIGIFKGAEFVPTYGGRTVNVESTSILFPEGIANFVIRVDKILQTDMDRVRKGEILVHFFGKVGYDDVFDQRHCTTFCYLLLGDLRTLAVCPYYNDVSDTDCKED